MDPKQRPSEHTASSPGGPPARIELPRGVVVGRRFEILRMLGKGGSGIVYAALDREIGQKVALKVLHSDSLSDEARERLRREVGTARASHPNLVTVFDFGESDRLTYLVMELVEGESLKERLAREGRLDPQQAVAVGRDIATALTFLHGRGIVHRDVKPGNILIDRATGRAMLGDAGLARPVDQGATVTATKIVVGTPAYMAPEQATGTRAGTAMDIYALGLVLYECLTGEVPLRDETVLSTLMRRQRDRPPSVRKLRRDTPRWLARLVTSMLEPDPRDRPSTGQVLDALKVHRFRTVPSLRQVAVFLLILGAVAAAGIAWNSAGSRLAIRFSLEGDTFQGVDERGRVAWAIPLGPGTHRMVLLHEDGDGRAEAAVATYGPTRLSEDGEVLDWNPGRVLVVDSSGAIRSRCDLAKPLAHNWGFPYPKKTVVTLWPVDLDHDGRQDLVIGAHHRSFYPQVLVVHWAGTNRWQPVLSHAGWVRTVKALPPENGRCRLFFTAVANLLGRAMVAGVVAIEPPAPSNGHPGSSPEDHAPALHGPNVSLGTPGLRVTAYVPINFRDGEQIVTELGNSLLRIRTSDWTVRLDRYWNPVPGPNEGRDLRTLRLRFLEELTNLSGRQRPPTRSNVEAVLTTIEQKAAPLLAEHPYRAILAEQEALAYAKAGYPLLGARRLQRGVLCADCTRFELERLELLAVAGRLGEAEDEAAALLHEKLASPVEYDIELLLHRLTLELHDQQGFEALMHRASTGRTEYLSKRTVFNEQYRALLLRRAHLWWDTLDAADAQPLESGYDPGGPAVTILCRWRLGRVEPEDEERARQLLAETGGTEAEYALALAAARLGLGRPGDALRTLEPLLQQLQTTSRTSFLELQNLELARSLHAVALRDAGDFHGAAREARTFLASAHPETLPAILAREILHEVS